LFSSLSTYSANTSASKLNLLSTIIDCWQ
jgi:hypothetical protein